MPRMELQGRVARQFGEARGHLVCRQAAQIQRQQFTAPPHSFFCQRAAAPADKSLVSGIKNGPVAAVHLRLVEFVKPGAADVGRTLRRAQRAPVALVMRPAIAVGFKQP